ncbi:MAG: acyltransferase [Thermoleophilaceae bacterium]|nr:acyltransferase [Thermoleophilaceae bacterium]
MAAAHAGSFLVPDVQPWPLQGGFLGVDLFFVLSGFLITGLLLAELDARRRIRLGRFYGRRLMRLVPALVGLLAAHWVYTLIVNYSVSSEWNATLYALTFSSNWQVTLGIDPAVDVPLDLLHLWTLGIEAQFYLVWPLLLWLIHRVSPSGRNLVAWIGGAIAVVVVVRALEFNAWDEPALVYTRFDTRADALLVGALLAVLVARGVRPPAHVERALAWIAGAGLVVALVFAYPAAPSLYWGGFTLVALGGALLIARAFDGRSPLARVLSTRPLRAIGLASYSIYLWHLPLFIWSVRIDSIPLRLIVAFGLTAVASAASYALLERPYMRRRGRVPSRPKVARETA